MVLEWWLKEMLVLWTSHQNFKRKLPAKDFCLMMVTMLLPKIVKIPSDPLWISWNKVCLGLTRTISLKPWYPDSQFTKAVHQPEAASLQQQSIDAV
ncbi:hypothetical protein LAZ67_17002961 [Cordylochernes scorpioides]|uniref:Uncharacterized protein n=1 Tax=Cordylochernes scorpioides TaxID=51811 RepID=A0ABY6LEB0_9ARAC|nr:hypothetical protein LAZ67_17002961 [Cordylochernes scorpioides]